ncbi:fumarate hydratase [Salmonella enterica subsp. enterica serovar Morehead]|nr:fumarate hydratase [Salmonella enterica subsp. enterica serovar Newport]EEM2539466.1 fumarate hydratase [Salmonella enterica subsp. enterica serovar Morehead]
MKTYELTLPVSSEAVKKLEVGDTVYLNGTVCTARDMAHLELRRLLEQGKESPVDLHGAAIFHAGPVCVKDGDKWNLRVIGPTTSIRMEPHAEWVGRDLGVKFIIGKGGMGKGSLDAFKKYGQAYLQACPGCAVVLSEGIRQVREVHWIENGMPEAMWVLEAEKFGPFVVTMDAHGNSRYDNIKADAIRAADKAYPASMA